MTKKDTQAVILAGLASLIVGIGFYFIRRQTKEIPEIDPSTVVWEE